MEYLGLIGILVAILAIIYLAVKGLNIVIAAPLATLIVILTNNMDIFQSLVGKEQSYMVGLSGFLINNFAIFLLGSVLAQYMEKSNATIAIAEYILGKLGKDKPYTVLIAITLIASILTYGGISVFVVMFALIPLAKPIFKELNINWELFPIPIFLGMSTFTMTMLPGTPSIHNAIPTKVLGTSLTASALLGIVGSIIVIIFGLVYMKYQLNKSIRNNEDFYSYLPEGSEKGEVTSADLSKLKIPSVIKSLIPIVTLATIILIFSKTPNIILIALTISILVCAVLFHKNIGGNQMAILNNGATGSVMPAFATSSSVAFGTVLTSAAGFGLIRNLIMNIPGTPIMGLSLATILLGGITGSSSGALGIVMNTFVQSYVEMGLNPELIHRIAVISSALLTVVPHSGVILTFNALTGLTIKKGFKHMFVIVNVGHLIVLLVLLVLVAFIY